MGYLDIALRVIEEKPERKEKQTRGNGQDFSMGTNYELNELNERMSSSEKAIPIQAEASLSSHKPYLDKEGDLVIPSGSDLKYHWWNGGQSISDTLNELTREELNSAKGDENCQSE